MMKYRSTSAAIVLASVFFLVSAIADANALGLLVPQQTLSPRRAALQYEPPTAQIPPSFAPLAPARAPDPAMPEVVQTLATEAPSPTPLGPGQVTDRQLLISPGHLNDIAFADAQNGIAVGNQGLLWRTTDGGRRWSAVRTDWSGDFHSIAFADQKNGWIVGGRALPIRGLYEGVVLRTQDGGVTWRQLSTTLLTKLTRIGYDHQLKKLWAVGEPDGQFSTGLFESFDLGQNWNDISFQVASDTMLASGTRASESTNVDSALCVGEDWILSNRLGIFRVAGDRAMPVAIATSPRAASGSSSALRFRQIRGLGNRLAALGTDGCVYLSRNRGKKWEPVVSLPDEIDAAHLGLLTTAGDSLWIVNQVGQHVYRYDIQNQSWATQTLPLAAQVNAIHFIDERMGWIAGIHGQVWSTQDGGQNWQLQHQSQSHVSILLLAAQAEDIPQELVAHFAVNQGLQVGVLFGRTEIPLGVTEQAFWQNEVASVTIDPVPFDPQQPADLLARRVRSYLTALRPRVILVCPTLQDANTNVSKSALASSHVQTSLWLEAAQEQRGSGEPGVAVLATISGNGEGETSISSQALATQVGQLLHDIAWQSRTLMSSWQTEVAPTLQRDVQKSWSIRRLASLESADMSWVHPLTANKDSFGRTLPTRPVRTRTSAANIDGINQMTRKYTWMHQLQRVPTPTATAREQWRRGLYDQLSIPESLQPFWLVDLADQCVARGDTRKATLVRYEVVKSALDKPEGLVALIPTLDWLVSDEAQWETRAEARAERLQRFAELQRLFAEEAAEGELSEQERLYKALHRFGVEPGTEHQVPAEAVEKILLLDKAQRDATREGRIKPDPEVARLAAVPQARMLTDTQSKKFENKLGQMQHHSTTISWDSPLEPDAPATVTATATTQPVSGVVDLPLEQRLQIASGLIRRAESLWPGLNGLPEWWHIKARVRQELRDVAQTEVAWNKLIEMAVDPLLADSSYRPRWSREELEQHRFVSLAMAEYGERFRLESLHSSVSMKAISHSNAAGLAPQQDVQVRCLPVHWTLERPYLDGQLDEALWQWESTEQTLAIAQDEQYLYIAIRLPIDGIPSEGPDANTSRAPVNREGRDQASTESCVTLLLDTDADDSNSFRISFDAEGGIKEQQNGLVNWNPALFAARQIGPNQRHLEVAIDLEDLAPTRSGKPWRVQLQTQSGHQTHLWERAWIQLTNLFGE
jgi:photosystem II stability/assembly factor-like uncharacterized protein